MDIATIALIVLIAVVSLTAGFYAGRQSRTAPKLTIWDKLIEAASFAYSIIETLKKAGVFPDDMDGRILKIEQRAVEEAQKYLRTRYGIDFDMGIILDAIRAKYSGWDRY
jgi:hypothetical protein